MLLSRQSTAEPIESTALTLQSIYNVQRGNCLALRVLGVSDGIADDGFKERLEDATGFLIDH